MYKAISLGWGVQSWTLAVMSALGELEPVDVAVHSDTQHEYQRTYDFAATWTPWLERHGVHVAAVTNEKERQTAILADNGVMIPAYTNRDGAKGQIHRQCTKEWKIRPMRRYLQAHRQGQDCEVWLGISTDEFQRAKDADVQYIHHRFPLLERGFSRQDCLNWLAMIGLPSPGKSSCVFCPFQNKAAWQLLRENGGADWQEALEVDSMVRDAILPGECFVHTKRLPLAEAIPATVKGQVITLTPIELLASDDADAECDSGHCFL